MKTKEMFQVKKTKEIQLNVMVFNYILEQKNNIKRTVCEIWIEYVINIILY